MSSKIIRPIRLLPILAVLAACLSLPALAGAKVTYSMKWNKSAVLVNPTKGDGLDSIGCSSTAKTNLCVAGDLHGNVWATAHPSRPGKGWRRETIDNTSYAITGVSCPTTTLCIAIDSAGQVLHSTKPLSGATAWTKPARIDTATQPGGAYAGLSAISCPTATLCVAVDNATNGQVAYTTTPNGPASSWHLVTIGQNVTLSSVSCSIGHPVRDRRQRALLLDHAHGGGERLEGDRDAERRRGVDHVFELRRHEALRRRRLRERGRGARKRNIDADHDNHGLGAQCDRQ